MPIAQQSFDNRYSRSPRLHWTVGQIASPVESLSPGTKCAEVFELFIAKPSLQAMALVDEAGKVRGLVNRHRFLERYAQRYIPEIYGPRPISSLANLTPLVVDESLAVGEFGAALAETPDAIMNGFVITRAGRYLGIGTGDALVRAKVKLLLRQEKILRDAVEEAKEANKTKSNFLALMSHELRTPLNAIIGFSEVLKTELFGPLGSDRYRDYAKHVHNAGHHLLQLINDILDLSKAEAGKMELTRDHIVVADVVHECWQLLEQRAMERRIDLSVEVPETFPLLYADRLRIKQILLNLMTNAIKFTHPGGAVAVTAERDGEGGIALRVADTGIGIAPEMIPVVLEPFRQVSSPMAREVEGTGLGLTLVKSLTEQHGGSFTLESALGAGTTAIVHFPQALLKAADEPQHRGHGIGHFPIIRHDPNMARAKQAGG